MADRVIHASVYVGSRKVAYSDSARLRFNSNGEQIITDEVIFESDGKVTSELEFSEVVPVTGQDSGAVAMLLGQEDVSCGFLAGGVMYKIPGRFNTGELQSASAGGTLKGSMTFRGGTPEPT